MKPYGNKYGKGKETLRSKSKTARLIAKNADRGLKKIARQDWKREMKNL